MSSSDSNSTSDDDFIIEVLQVLPRSRSFHDRSNPFTEYDDIDFKQRFRYLLINKIFNLTIFIYYD